MNPSGRLYTPAYPATDGFKRCSACKEIKPVSEFHHTDGNTDGLIARCKDCIREAYKRDHAVRDTPTPITPEMSPGERDAAQRRNDKIEKRLARQGTAIREYQEAYREAHREQFREEWREKRKQDPEFYSQRTRRRLLVREYGITPEQFDEMATRQNGRCAICGCVPEKWLCVDHDHTTGMVRGLLCSACNFGLGKFKDNPENIMNAIAYLERTRSTIDDPLELAA